MSVLSGYDSEAIGFDSISQSKSKESTASTQTTEFDEAGVGSQTALSKDCGSLACPFELNAGDDLLKEYPPPGLNEFLRKVVPGMLEQLDLNEHEVPANSSDSEEEEAPQAKLVEEYDAGDDVPDSGSGDGQPSAVSCLSFSGAGGALAAGGAGRGGRAGRLRLLGRRPEPALEPDAPVTAVLYHPSVAGLVAYGTRSGAVCARGAGPALEAAHAHAARPVAALAWPLPPLGQRLLQAAGRGRHPADQVLMSAGADGSVRAWLVNTTAKRLECISVYVPGGAGPALDITAFDVIKSYPLRPCDEKPADDIFVVGTSTGALYQCGIKDATPLSDGRWAPSRTRLGGAPASVATVAFSSHRAGVFAALAGDELRLYRVDQVEPIKVFCLEEPAPCLAWAGGACAVGAAAGGAYLVGAARAVHGLNGGAAATAIAVHYSGSWRIAVGDATGAVRVFELPARRSRLEPADLDY